MVERVRASSASRVTVASRTGTGRPPIRRGHSTVVSWTPRTMASTSSNGLPPSCTWVASVRWTTSLPGILPRMGVSRREHCVSSSSGAAFQVPSSKTAWLDWTNDGSGRVTKKRCFRSVRRSFFPLAGLDLARLSPPLAPVPSIATSTRPSASTRCSKRVRRTVTTSFDPTSASRASSTSVFDAGTSYVARTNVRRSSLAISTSWASSPSWRHARRGSQQGLVHSPV